MKLTSAIFLIIVGDTLNACASTERWKESVQLSDGSIVVVDREILNEPGGDEWAFNRAGIKPKEYRIRFTVPAGARQTIEWRSIKKSPQTWPESPLIFDIEAGHPVVYTIVDVSLACGVYMKYRYDGGTWKEQDLPDQFEERTTNLLIRDGIDIPKSVTLEEKRLANAEAGYRHTLRHVGPSRKVCG